MLVSDTHTHTHIYIYNIENTCIFSSSSHKHLFFGGFVLTIDNHPKAGWVQTPVLDPYIGKHICQYQLYINTKTDLVLNEVLKLEQIQEGPGWYESLPKHPNCTMDEVWYIQHSILIPHTQLVIQSVSSWEGPGGQFNTRILYIALWVSVGRCPAQSLRYLRFQSDKSCVRKNR